MSILRKNLLASSKKLRNSLTEYMHSNCIPNYFVYNVFDYAWSTWSSYIERYALASAHILFLGINPGPHGMVQTGIPFGNITSVVDWLQIIPRIDSLNFTPHPKRPILGSSYKREEPSGLLFWSTVQSVFKTPQQFFSKCFVLNYCPLAFFIDNKNAENITPDKLPSEYRTHIETLCSTHLIEYIQTFKFKRIIAIGRYTLKLVETILKNSAYNTASSISSSISTHYLTHPSPLNPKRKFFHEEFVNLLSQF